MKFLDLEVSNYLASLGCVSESDMYWARPLMESDNAGYDYDLISELEKKQTSYWHVVAAFFLEDLLRKENAEKIWGKFLVEGEENWYWMCREVLTWFHEHPDTWPEEVKKLILK